MLKDVLFFSVLNKNYTKDQHEVLSTILKEEVFFIVVKAMKMFLLSMVLKNKETFQKTVSIDKGLKEQKLTLTFSLFTLVSYHIPACFYQQAFLNKENQKDFFVRIMSTLKNSRIYYQKGVVLHKILPSGCIRKEEKI